MKQKKQNKQSYGAKFNKENKKGKKNQSYGAEFKKDNKDNKQSKKSNQNYGSKFNKDNKSSHKKDFKSKKSNQSYGSKFNKDNVSKQNKNYDKLNKEIKPKERNSNIKVSFSETENRVDPKLMVHYYVDGGVQGSIAAAAFLKKGFKHKTKEETRKYYRNMRSTDAEIRAIRIAMDDAIASGIDPKNVVIHTDQKHLVFGSNDGGNNIYSDLKKEINEKGFNLAYLASIHSLSHKKEDKITKREENALRVHELVNEEFSKPNNRYRYHLNKKRAKKRANKRK